jgi:uncharacterized protein YkwD
MKSLRHSLVLPAFAASLAFAAPASAGTSSKWVLAPVAHASSACSHADDRPGAASEGELAKAAVCLINKQRARRGLRRLRVNSRLSEAARRHTVDMVRRNYFSHTSRSGSDVVDRLARTGYMRGARAWTVGENLAWGSGDRSTPREIMAAWMESPGHRANILRSRFREIGIGVVFEAPHNARGAAATYTTTFCARK